MKLFKLMEDVSFTSNLPLEKINEIEIKDISYNSRSCKEGFIFVALVGETVDGHKFAKNAYDNGARVFLLQKGMESSKYVIELPNDTVKLFVEDTRISLSRISHNFFEKPSNSLKIIGVTGTKGKTTITNYIATVLNESGVNTGVVGTNGTFFNGTYEVTSNTTPESYELHRIFRKMLDNGVTCVSMEVSSGGIMQNRVEDVDFDVAIFSNLSPDHIGPKEHPTFEHYLQCKARLFKMAKHGIINVDDDYAKDVINAATCDVETFGIENEANLTANNIRYSKEIDSLGVSFDCNTKEETFPCFICSPGTFSIYNALAVVAVCKYLDVKKEIMIDALKSAKVSGRVEVLPILPYATVIVDYAHNGVSLENILQTLKNYDHDRLICLFGSVGGRTEIRRKELGDVAARECDLAILTADNPDFEDPMNVINDIAESFEGSSCEVIKISDREEAIKYTIRNAKEGDMIVFAGKGHEKYQLINGEKLPFDEIAIAKDEAKKVIEEKELLA
ncbi:UDP-N-acetylmuramoyl-L-alanyl-D-glutamate--2,6-diaminopimelate ligase [Terrisporobacter glycolicus]|uniref:UDP-N-acetylmuramyl-tripeptide synthetase n=1 Tax=Terrisporobacter glycolicus ATCC 14880 = DSM 1288 TaxID=1121315 RepID=A0ABZ2ESE0_9FIRM|nr:UDP-N-acetylmuramoyl-L-alanyl-D-glutamate--2,6-diaminopimelate ligase [Terrisporobacter glycolicus]